MDKRTNRPAVIGRDRVIGAQWKPSVRRGSLASRPMCDLLEGRQLLSTMAAPTSWGGDSSQQSQPPAQVGQFDGQAQQQAPNFGGQGQGGSRGMGMSFNRSNAPDFSQGGAPQVQATSTTTGSTILSARSGMFGVRGGTVGGLSMPGTISNTGGQGDVFWGQAAQTTATTTNADGTTTTTTTTTTANADALKTDFDKLHTDIQAIQDKSQVTPALLAAVRNDIQSIMKASTATPDSDLVDAVAKDLAALNGATPDFTTGTLQTDLEAVITSAGVTDTTLMSTLETDLNAVYAARGITADDIATIQADADQIKTDSGSTTSDSDNMIVASLSELPGIPHLSDLIGSSRKDSTSTSTSTSTDSTTTTAQGLPQLQAQAQQGGQFNLGGGMGGGMRGGQGGGMRGGMGGPMGF